MMIDRRLSNNKSTLSMVAAAFVVAVIGFDATSTVEARLRGSASKPTMPKAPQQRRLGSTDKEEEEEDAMLLKLEQEYHLEEQYRKLAIDDAMAMHNHVVSDEDALAEMYSLESLIHEEEQQFQEEEEQKKKIAEQQQQESLVRDAELEIEKSLREEQEELDRYEYDLKMKKQDEINDNQLIRDAEDASKVHQELVETIEQNMKEHMRGNDENSALEDEQKIQISHEEELKLQQEDQECTKEKMEREQKEYEEYVRQQEELEQKTMDQLVGR